jgi:putative FmdB family regulatory protein
MPIYEYKCRDCGSISEKLILTGESADDLRCDRCDSQRLEKIFSTVSFLNKDVVSHSGHTCCGQEERCDAPPCASGGVCRRERD